MGLHEDAETSLQVLRGFETDITNELNEIKVCYSFFFFSHLFIRELYFISCDSVNSLCFVKKSVASSTKRTAIRFSELKRRRYWYPLMVLCIIFKDFSPYTQRYLFLLAHAMSIHWLSSRWELDFLYSSN